MNRLSAPRRKHVGVSTAGDAACFVLFLEAPHRVRLRPASLPSTPLTRRNSRTYLRRRALSLLAVVLVATAACSTGNNHDDLQTSGAGAGTPVEAVDQLVALFNVADFTAAADLALPDQAALASLAEGASFGDVATALNEGDASVAASFWTGFAQGAGSFLTGAVANSDGGVEVVGGVEFHVVRVIPEGGAERVIITRERDGHRVDLFASFGGGMAARMLQPVERLLITQTDDARLILQKLNEAVPSLLLAANNPDLLPEVSHDLIRLVEVITRAR